MREFVGVRSPLELVIEVGSQRIPVERVFKREALMFQRIACPYLGQVVAAFDTIGNIAQPISNQLCAHINYLREQRVIFEDVSSADGAELDVLRFDTEFQNLTTIEEPLAQSLLTAIQNAGLEEILKRQDLTVDEMLPHLDNLPSVIGPLFCALQLIVRKLSIQLKVLNGMDAYPIFSEMFPAIPFPQDRKCEVVDVVIKALPLPDDSVPWEQIIEYRNDPESQSKFLALRIWMSEMARAEITSAEVEEKLEYLIDQYQRHMKLHRIKTNVGRLETVLVAGVNFFSFKWGEVAQALFSSKRRELSLLQGELTSPGSEVAFIVDAREKFVAADNHGSIK